VSNLGAQAAKAKRESTDGTHREESREWRGMVVRMGQGGTEWARVAIPESVLRQYLVGQMEPPNTRGIVAAHIENELRGDPFVEGRGWPR